MGLRCFSGPKDFPISFLSPFSSLREKRKDGQEEEESKKSQPKRKTFIKRDEAESLGGFFKSGFAWGFGDQNQL